VPSIKRTLNIKLNQAFKVIQSSLLVPAEMKNGVLS